MEYPAFQIVQIFSSSVWLLVLTAFKTSVSLLLILLSSVFNELIISCARFVHLAQGPHFKYSKWSVSGQSHSRGFKHLDIASPLPCLDTGLYSTVKSNAERISTHLANQCLVICSDSKSSSQQVLSIVRYEISHC